MTPTTDEEIKHLAEKLYVLSQAKKQKIKEFVHLNTNSLSILTYIVDWVTFSGILAISMIWGYLKIPRKSDFSFNDITLMHAYIPESQSYAPIGYLIIVVAIITPIIIIVMSYLMSKTESSRRKYWEVHCAFLATLGSISCQLAVVVMIKNTAGVPRPDFLERCIPNYQLALPKDTLASVNICLQGNQAIINEGFRSFPSGHSSTIFAS